jgi:bifunctional DNase/RNase
MLPGRQSRSQAVPWNQAGVRRAASFRLLDSERIETSMPVEMKLAKIIISEINENQVVFLREVDGTRQFPILIGIYEATSIDRRVKDFPRIRPLTHDLLVNTVEALGGEFDSVVISELKQQTYFAKLRIKQGGELVEIDCRPSDAIAIAVTCNPHLPIFVAEEVIDEALLPDSGQL